MKYIQHGNVYSEQKENLQSFSNSCCYHGPQLHWCAHYFERGGSFPAVSFLFALVMLYTYLTSSLIISVLINSLPYSRLPERLPEPRAETHWPLTTGVPMPCLLPNIYLFSHPQYHSSPLSECLSSILKEETQRSHLRMPFPQCVTLGYKAPPSHKPEITSLCSSNYSFITCLLSDTGPNLNFMLFPPLLPITAVLCLM